MASLPASAQNLIAPGDGVVTRFSGAVPAPDGTTVIDLDGASALGFVLGNPGAAPSGSNATDLFPRGFEVPARAIGQVFGLAIAPGDPPVVYFGATSAFGLHLAANGVDWMDGQWGTDGGPGTIYRLTASEGSVPEVLADVTLGDRENTGAALGAVAYDPVNDQVFVSDLETGTIHRLDAEDGEELGRFDHGVDARANFYDVPSADEDSLDPIAFDPETKARIDDCPSGDFSRTPSCWNFADFRRRVFGLAVFHDPLLNESRLFYSVWGSQGFGNLDYAAAGDDQRNSVWSIRLTDDGGFDLSDIRREFFLPDFFRTPEEIARAGLSNPVTDIAFAATSGRTVMLLAERGGVRNLGLAADSAFAYPHEARVLRYELANDGSWQAVGRYDVGQYDRQDDGPPYLRANAAGGVSFGMGYDEEWSIDTAAPDAFAWLTGDGLCAPSGACFDPSSGDHSDESPVDGLQGGAADLYADVDPDAAFKPYPSPGPAMPGSGPDASWMVDAADPADDDASRIGNVEVYQPGPVHIAGAPLVVGEASDDGFPEEDDEEDYEPGWDPAPLPDDDDWWPPPPDFIDSDLAIDKDGPLSCQVGVVCAYTIRITNLGPVPYIGPLAVNDTMPDGASLSTASPGWDCIETAPNVSCITLGFAILPVGSSATLHLDVLLPTPIPAGFVTNCVGIDWFEMGTDDGPGDGNDFACIDTPVTPGFNLGLQKDGAANCVEGASCPFLLTITNHGPGTLNGVLAFHDTLPAGATFLNAGGGMGCVQSGNSLDCQASGVTLPSGGFAWVLMQIELPTGVAGGTVENCAEIDWDEMGADDGEPDPHADDDCHTVNVLPLAGFFDLTIQKSGPAHCDPGGNCTYELKLTNEGPDDYTGALLIRDAMPIGSTFVSASPGWACLTLAFVTSCDLLGAPHTLHPGDSASLTLTVDLPAPIAAPTVTNCTNIRFGDPGMPVADNPPPPVWFEKPDSDCISTNVTDGFDLEVSKFGPTECFEGGVCEYQIGVTNNGPRAINAGDVIAVTDTLPAGASVESVSVGWSCFDAGPAAATCVKEHAALPSGSTSVFTLGVRLPDPVIGFTVDNCAEMDWVSAYPGGPDPTYTGDDNAGTDGPACVTTPVFAADLAPFGATVCERGALCTLDVSIDNRGGRTFKGAAGIRGNLSPAVRIDSIVSLTDGLSCAVEGQGSYACDAPDLILKAGDRAPFRVVIDIPADFPESRIVHQKQMIWPDARVKDPEPQNDRHVSTIVIPQPTPPACEGGDLIDGRCVCPEGSISVRRGENDFACMLPELVCEGGTIRNGQCVCPAGDDIRQTGSNAYQCVPPPPPQIICEGGRVRRGECVCPQGYDIRQTGEFSFICVPPPPPPEIICEGGRVRRGECVCPQGHDIVQRGEFRFECLPPPPPELICEGGRVRNNRCVCPEGTDRNRISEFHYRCEVPPPPEIICEGGRVRNDRCVCPEGTERQRITDRDNAWRCVEPPPPEIICEGGRVRNNRCVCPEGTERQRITDRDNAWRCVEPPPPEIICEGGRVRNNRCVCPDGTERQRITDRDNAWQCVAPPPPEIICEGGRVRNNRCVCPDGTERQATGDNAWQCVAVQPEVICEGGRVRNGRCNCPDGTERQSIGDNSWRCVAEEQEIVCEGGNVRGGQCRCPRGSERQRTGENSFVCVKGGPTDENGETEPPRLELPRFQLQVPQ